MKEKSLQKCVSPTTITPSSRITDDWTGFTVKNLPRRCTLSKKSPAPSGKTQGASPLLMCSGLASPQGHQQSLSSPPLPLKSSSVAGCVPRGSSGASLGIGSSFPPLPLPLFLALRRRDGSAGVPPSKAAKWVRTPSMWASVPRAYLPTPVPTAQLPFTQFPLMCYDGSLERGGYPFSPFPSVDFMVGRPSDVTTAWLSSSQRPGSSSCMTRSQLPGGHVSRGQPQLLQLQPQYPGPLLGPNFPMTRWNPSPSRSITLHRPGDPHCTLRNQSCSPSRRLIPKREQPVCYPQ